MVRGIVDGASFWRPKALQKRSKNASATQARFFIDFGTPFCDHLTIPASFFVFFKRQRRQILPESTTNPRPRTTKNRQEPPRTNTEQGTQTVYSGQQPQTCNPHNTVNLKQTRLSKRHSLKTGGAVSRRMASSIRSGPSGRPRRV